MISFDALAGNNALKNSLKHALNERFPQTVLLSGDDPAALKTLATVLAAGILCEGAGSHPCGNCLPCRKVEQGVHPDLMIVDEGEAELKVDLARQLKAENAIIPNDGERRVTVIHHAQNLNPMAQNALLKELEEPPAYAFFILTAEQPDSLLQTVRSRCTKFALEPSQAAVSDEEAVSLLAALDKESMQHQVIVKLLLFTGMRRGELCGLEWKDIDFERAVIFVRRSSLYLPGKGVFEDETKNETSERCMKVSADVVTMLKAWRAEQSKQRLRMGDQWQTSDRLFTAWNGAPIRPDVITAWFHKFVTKNGLPPIHIHSLRHTNATLLIAAGTNLTTVAARLGHANSTTTSKIYAHAIKSADQAAAEVLQDILHPVKKQA